MSSSATRRIFSLGKSAFSHQNWNNSLSINWCQFYITRVLASCFLVADVSLTFNLHQSELRNFLRSLWLVLTYMKVKTTRHCWRTLGYCIVCLWPPSLWEYVEILVVVSPVYDGIHTTIGADRDQQTLGCPGRQLKLTRSEILLSHGCITR